MSSLNEVRVSVREYPEDNKEYQTLVVRNHEEDRFSDPLQGWFIVELMGHRRLAGYVTEQTIAGAGFLRIDVPGPDGQPMATQFYTPASVYAMTPTTEAMARRVAEASRVAPVTEWELPRPALPSAAESRPELDALRPAIMCCGMESEACNPENPLERRCVVWPAHEWTIPMAHEVIEQGG